MDECQSCTGVKGFGYCSDENLEYWNINGEIVNYTLASYPGSWWVGLGMSIYTKLKRPDVINYHKKMAEIYTHDFLYAEIKHTSTDQRFHHHHCWHQHQHLYHFSSFSKISTHKWIVILRE